jgi:26S proteasome regulatory subunit N6
MSSISELLKQAQENPDQAERIYKQILSSTSGILWLSFFFMFIDCFLVLATSRDARDHDQSQNLRDQEVALVKLGELYRDQKCAPLPALETFRN